LELLHIPPNDLWPNADMFLKQQQATQEKARKAVEEVKAVELAKAAHLESIRLEKEREKKRLADEAAAAEKSKKGKKKKGKIVVDGELEPIIQIETNLNEGKEHIEGNEQTPLEVEEDELLTQDLSVKEDSAVLESERSIVSLEDSIE
jgi:hypothetical protein